MEIKYRNRNFTTGVYTAPIHPAGWFTAWGNKHPSWRRGFIVRALWFGFVVRWSRVPFWETPRGKFLKAIEEANDGDYMPVDFLNEMEAG